jgi:hypothetical protein
MCVNFLQDLCGHSGSVAIGRSKLRRQCPSLQPSTISISSAAKLYNAYTNESISLSADTSPCNRTKAINGCIAVVFEPSEWFVDKLRPEAYIDLQIVFL